MYKYILFLIFVIIENSALAQCLTSSLIINTGYNPITGLAIPGGANGAAAVQDPHWILTAASPATGAAIAATPIPGLVAVVPGNRADVVTPVGGAWVANPGGNPGNWISGMNSNTYNDQGTGLLYTMTFGRPFRMCTDDSIRFTFYISSDNFTSAANIDGTIVIPTPATGFNAYTFYTQTVWLTTGTHTINFVVNNQNLASLGSNPTGINVYGTIASATGINSMVSESYASCSSYTCGSSCNTISLPDSLHLCQGGSDTLRAAIIGTDSVLNMAWTPIAGLSSSTVLRPLLTVGTTSGWYDITIESLTPYNLVYNGDFSLGNIGFTSTYTYGAGTNSIWNAGTYAITTSPSLVHNGTAAFGDHTTGTGNMMAINGASSATSVWCQTIPVPPNTDFAFSAWVANWSVPGPGQEPILQFMINGTLIGVPITITSAVGAWVHFYAIWNSGANTTASICIYDACTAASGNDFALDDISFQQMCIAKDSIYVKVNSPDTTYSHKDTSLCASVTSVTLTAPTGYNPYLWNTGSNSTSINVSTAGAYWVYATSYCAMLIDTFHLVFRPLPAAPVTRDTSYCVGYGFPASLSVLVDSVPGTLNWYLSGGALYGNTPPPVITTTANYPIGTTWTVSQTVNGCEGATAPVTVRIVPPPAISIAARPWVCQFDSISLTYTGPALVNGGFLWILPKGATVVNGTSLTDSSIYVQFDSTNGNNNVYLIANNLLGECSNEDSIKIQVIKLPTANAYSKADVCMRDTVSLAISSRSADATDFTWYIDNSPLFSSSAAIVISANSNSGGPFSISWTDSGLHIIYVQAFAEHGCTDKPTADTVEVHALPDASFRITTLGGTLCLEDSVLFTANDSNYQNIYKWAPVHFFNNVDKYATWGRVELEHSVVTLTVTDPFGCVASGSREIDPSVCCNVPFPNAFSPNGDGHNDVFRPIPMRAYHRYHVFRIENRWGQTIFESSNNKAEWDGTFNGVLQDIGVYFYYLKYDCDGKTIEQKGDVTLIR